MECRRRLTGIPAKPRHGFGRARTGDATGNQVTALCFQRRFRRGTMDALSSWAGTPVCQMGVARDSTRRHPQRGGSGPSGSSLLSSVILRRVHRANRVFKKGLSEQERFPVGISRPFSAAGVAGRASLTKSEMAAQTDHVGSMGCWRGALPGAPGRERPGAPWSYRIPPRAQNRSVVHRLAERS